MAKLKRTVDSRGYVREVVVLGNKRYDLRAKTDEELDNKIYNIRSEYEATHINVDKNITVEKWSEQWLKIYKQDSEKVSDAHLAHYKSMINKHINPYIGNMQMYTVKPIHLKNLLNMHKGKSQSHVDKLLLTIRQIFETAVINEIIAINPSQRLEKPKTTYTGHRCVTDDERETLNKMIYDKVDDYIWILLMMYCGLRPAESAALRWDNINFKDKYFSITEAVDTSKQRKLKGTKTKAGNRYIPLPDNVYNALNTIPEENRGTYIIETSHGNFMNKHRMRKRWEAVIRTMNIYNGVKPIRRSISPDRMVIAHDLTPYDLRHTYASDQQNAGVSLNILKDLMGHEEIATTTIYTHTLLSTLEQARQLQNNYINSSKNI